MAEAAVAAVVKFAAAAAAKITVKAVVTAAAKVALMAGINAVVQNNSKPEQQGGLTTLTINPAEPRRLQVGKRLNAGVLVDWYVRGSKNQNLYLVIYLGEGPMGALTRVFAGGRVVYDVTAPGSSAFSHGVRKTIPDFRSGGDRLWVTYYDGRAGQTADANLVGYGLGWTSTCVGTGCAYVIVECQWDSDNLTSPPQLAFELEGAKLYDRRLDTTAGGSGSHRIDDPSTWAVSSNPAVALDHYLLGRYLDSVKTFGIGLDPEDVPYDRFAALANLCDEDVTLKAGGTQNRYESHGFLFADRSYSDTIKDLCRAMNARPADFGGRVGILDGESRTPVMTLTDDDVIEDATEQYSPKRSWNDLVSEVRGTFQSPAQNYQAIDYPRITDASWVTADGGSAKEATLDLEMETNAERAQRLAWLYAMRERRQAQLTGTYKLRAIELEQGDWFIRDGTKWGEDGKVFEVIDRSLDPASLTVTLTAFEVDPADTAWTTDIPSDPPADAVSNEDTLLTMEVPDLTVTGITLSGTVAEKPAIKVEWTAPTDPRARNIVVEAVPQAGGTPVSLLVDAATEEVVFTSGITDDTDYYVRARFIGTFAPSDWTTLYEVSTTGDYYVGSATAISGLGWGALASEAEASNAQVPIGANAIGNSEFYAGISGWAGSNGGTGNTATMSLRAPGTSWAMPTRGTLMVYQADAGATGYFDVRFRPTNSAGASSYGLKVQPGDKVAARAHVSAHRCLCQLRIEWRDAAGAVLSYSGTPSNNADSSSSTEPDTWPLLSLIGTAPANAAWADIHIRKNPTLSGANSYMFLHKPMLAKMQAGATVIPEYSPGIALDVESGANVTGDHIAGGFIDQGGLATEDSVDTDTINAGAVNAGAANEVAGIQTINSSTWTTLATQAVTIPASASFVNVMFQVKALAVGSYLHTADSTLELQITRNGTQIWTSIVAVQGIPFYVRKTSGGLATIDSENIIVATTFNQLLSGFDIDPTPGSGTVTYVLQARRSAVAGEPTRANWSLSDRKLMVDVRKR